MNLQPGSSVLDGMSEIRRKRLNPVTPVVHFLLNCNRTIKWRHNAETNKTEKVSNYQKLIEAP